MGLFRRKAAGQDNELHLTIGYPEVVERAESADQLARTMLGFARKQSKGQPKDTEVHVQVPPDQQHIPYLELSLSLVKLAEEYGFSFTGLHDNTAHYSKR